MESTGKHDEEEGRALKKRGNRRAFLTGAAGAAVVAATATLLPEVAGSAQAASGDPLILGQVNEADATTRLHASVSGGPSGSNNTLFVHNHAAGDPEIAPEDHVGPIAIHGVAASTAVLGNGLNWGLGVHGMSESGRGVKGNSGSGTGVEGGSDSGPGVQGHSESGPGVRGESQSGPGVEASTATGMVAALGNNNSNGGAGVAGLSQNPAEPPIPGSFANGAGIGVYGGSGSGVGVEGYSESGYAGVAGRGREAGVFALTNSVPEDADPSIPDRMMAGVVGVSIEPMVGAKPSGDTIGVEGRTGAGIAVLGRSLGHSEVGRSGLGVGVLGLAPGDAPGVRALSAEPYGPKQPDGGLALDVVGKARFSTADSGVLPARARSATVENPAVTEHSHVTVMFTGNPRGARVAWVERQPGSGFVMHVKGVTPREVPFTYLIVEPADHGAAGGPGGTAAAL